MWRYVQCFILRIRFGRHDIQHNDTQHNDTQHNDTHHNDIQHNVIQHDRLNCDTQHDDNGKEATVNRALDGSTYPG